ncbi:hypothetical protein HPB52_010371 [Rhipicephalus sanguineus]|uniref:Uncharacterized protein n=1 Tax=Rhipicephalus sanguineus TaxID=34632 RepID=A0A9D4SUR9_RHISA|nr:hypothetical protein HPB52_010371 [Rhipicephalus sanguineus]
MEITEIACHLVQFTVRQMKGSTTERERIESQVRKAPMAPVVSPFSSISHTYPGDCDIATPLLRFEGLRDVQMPKEFLGKVDERKRLKEELDTHTQHPENLKELIYGISEFYDRIGEDVFEVNLVAGSTYPCFNALVDAGDDLMERARHRLQYRPPPPKTKSRATWHIRRTACLTQWQSPSTPQLSSSRGMRQSPRPVAQMGARADLRDEYSWRRSLHSPDLGLRLLALRRTRAIAEGLQLPVPAWVEPCLQYTSVQAAAFDDTSLNSDRSPLLRQNRQGTPPTRERWLSADGLSASLDSNRKTLREMARSIIKEELHPQATSTVKFVTRFYKRNPRRNLFDSNNNCRNVLYKRTPTLYANPPCTMLRLQPPVAAHPDLI